MELEQAKKTLDPCSVRIDPKIFDIGRIKEMLASGELILPGVAQPSSTWNRLSRSRLIESIALRIPFPTFYFDEDVLGTFRVIDGIQRLRAICDYIDGIYELAGAEYLSEDLNGKSFDNLKPWLQRRIIHTQLSVQVVQPCVPWEVKLNIFRRIRSSELLYPLEVSDRIKYLGLMGGSSSDTL